jgi:hypothetical protein
MCPPLGIEVEGSGREAGNRSTTLPSEQSVAFLDAHHGKPAARELGRRGLPAAVFAKRIGALASLRPFLRQSEDDVSAGKSGSS